MYWRDGAEEAFKKDKLYPCCLDKTIFMRNQLSLQLWNENIINIFHGY